VRILLVAYEFPPAHSPRALRWRYLCRELVLLGHEVHVLTPDRAGLRQAATALAALQLHAVFPGPLTWLLQRRTGGGHLPSGGGPVAASASGGQAGRLNWKGRLAQRMKGLLGLLLFPDASSEWLPWARGSLQRLLRDSPPDVVVTSHEPASTLLLGRAVHARGFRWVADLGDPVCAPYTPRRWRRRAWALEAAVVAEADHIIVTNQGACAMLSDRHGMAAEMCSVLPQGFDDRRMATLPADSAAPAADAPLELLFCGRLYGFRDPANLLQAVEQTPGIRLTLVLGDPPVGGMLDRLTSSGRVRVVDNLPHEQVLDLQRGADVLVNIANRSMPAQMPGKLFEYLGAGRPILHVRAAGEDADAASQLLIDGRRGWSVSDDPRQLGKLLGDLLALKRDGLLQHGLDLAPPREYAISALGERLSDILEQVARAKRKLPPVPAQA
jgi:hypothetical protein